MPDEWQGRKQDDPQEQQARQEHRAWERQQRQRSSGNSRARLGCAFGIITLLAGIALGIVLTLGALGVGWDVFFGRVTNPGNAPVIQVGPTATPPPVAIQGAAPGRRFITRPPIALDTDTNLPDLLVISRNFDRQVSTIAYLSADSGTIRWESPPLSKENDEYAWEVAYSAEQIVVAVQNRLVGLSRATGEQLWEAPLTDVVFTGCRDCVQVIGDSAIALSDDGQLQSFAAATGAPRWSVRLREAPRQLVETGGMVGVLDSRSDGEYGVELRRFAILDGAQAEPILLECREQGESGATQASIYDHLGRDPSGRLLFALLGDDPACLLSLESATGRLSGRTSIDGFNGDFEPDHMLWDSDTLYLQSANEIFAVGPTRVWSVLANEDYDLRPVAAGDDTLIVLATRTRGSPRLELWAVDAESGARRWERVLVARSWASAESSSGQAAAVVVADALALVEVVEAADELRYELIGLQNGISRARSVIGVEDPSDEIERLLAGRDRLLLATSELYALDAGSGQLISRWP